MKVNLFSVKGEEKGKVNLPDRFFEKSSEKLLSQALRFYEFNLYKVRPRRKTRSDVNISTRKIYRQKGTGGARHGARSAPIFVGGGLAHGPSGLKRLLRLPELIRRKALALALRDKLENNRLFLVEKLSSFKKTKEASQLIKNLLLKLNLASKNILVAFKSKDMDKTKAWNNVESVKISSWDNLNAYDVFVSDLLVLDSEIFEGGATTLKEENVPSKISHTKRQSSNSNLESNIKKETKRKILKKESK
jgi:large subunit ribosomal protein L4